MKTTFSSGVIVTSAFLNGAQQIYFDGQDLDWHYPPLGLNSLVRTGPNGLDSVYMTLGTNQPEIDPTGAYISGASISGTKVVSGIWNFGYNPLVAGNPTNLVANAPKSYTTNQKFQNAGSQTPPTIPPSIPQKLAALSDEDILTKLILLEALDNFYEELEIDNGVYESVADPACRNYAGESDVICPL